MEEQGLYDKYNKGKHWYGHPTEYAQRFSEFLKSVNFSGLLVDIGCGSGRDVDVFSSNGFEVVGIDNSEDEVENARATSAGLKFDIQDVENLSFVDDSVGAFFMINVIHYVDKKKAIGEIRRCLSNGGYFFVHFNLLITDVSGTVDYSDSDSDILALLDGFEVVEKRVFSRFDREPVEHTHEILELVLRKKISY